MHRYKAAYSAAFRQQIVELVQSGRSPKELAKEFGCHVTSIHHWVSVANGGLTSVKVSNNTAAPSAALSGSERQELIELRRKLRQVQMERDILAKATAWFANQSEKV